MRQSNATVVDTMCLVPQLRKLIRWRRDFHIQLISTRWLHLGLCICDSRKKKLFSLFMSWLPRWAQNIVSRMMYVGWKTFYSIFILHIIQRYLYKGKYVLNKHIINVLNYYALRIYTLQILRVSTIYFHVYFLKGHLDNIFPGFSL